MMTELRSGRVFIGLVLVIIGVLVLLHTTGVVDIGMAFRWLPSLLVLLGLWQLVAGRFRRLAGPVILMVVGVVIQLAVLGLLTGEAVSRWWPVALIVIGLAMILGRVQGQRRQAAAASDNSIRLLTLVGDTDHRSTATAFRGGQVTTLLGDTEVDLREATLGQRPARLDITVIFGDTRLVVPEGWSVRNEVTALLGDMKDRRGRHDRTVEGTPDLVITGVVLFGDLTLED